MFHYKKTLDSLVLEKGYFKIDTEDTVSIDTIYISCRWGEYDDILQFHSYYKPVKINSWTFIPSINESLRGKYVNGEKQGTWHHKKNDKEVYINFQMSDTVGISKPSIDLIEKHYHWLIDKDFHLCSKRLFQGDTLSTKLLQTFEFRSIDYHKSCEDYLLFNFLDDQNVEIKHKIVKATNSKDLSGRYEYTIDDDCHLTINLKEFGIIKRKIKYFSKDKIK